MDIKKILALTVLILALFSCMSVASAGWFDFWGPANETYNFTVFSLELPEGASVTNFTTNYDDGYKVETYTASFGTEEDGNKGSITALIMSGNNLVTSIDEFVNNWENLGGIYEGTYGDWAVINIDSVPISDNSDRTYDGYILARHNGDNIVSIRGTNLTQLKNIADTYKPI